MKMMIRAFDVSDLMITSKSFERELKPFLKVSVGETFVDVGAHIGRYVIFLANRVGPNGKVIAIEPHPENFALLVLNCEINNLNNVIPVNLALSDRSKTVKMFVIRQSGTHSIAIPKSPNAIYVKTSSLDELLSRFNIEKIDFILIDAVGAEFDIIKGAEKTIETNKKLRIIIEVFEIQRINEMINYLVSLGLSPKLITERHIYAEKFYQLKSRSPCYERYVYA
jgi:FkbM family methyltransferase